MPRDRSGSFEPLLIAKGQKRFEGFDEKIIAMYARGMTVREIGVFCLINDRVQVSAGFHLHGDRFGVEAVVEWHNRPVERSYPVLFRRPAVKIRNEGSVRNKAVYLALGIAAEGPKMSWAFGSSRTREPSSGQGHERAAQPRSGGHSYRGG